MRLTGLLIPASLSHIPRMNRPLMDEVCVCVFRGLGCNIAAVWISLRPVSKHTLCLHLYC